MCESCALLFIWEFLFVVCEFLGQKSCHNAQSVPCSTASHAIVVFTCIAIASFTTTACHDVAAGRGFGFNCVACSHQICLGMYYLFLLILFRLSWITLACIYALFSIKILFVEMSASMQVFCEIDTCFVVFLIQFTDSYLGDHLYKRGHPQLWVCFVIWCLFSCGQQRLLLGLAFSWLLSCFRIVNIQKINVSFLFVQKCLFECVSLWIVHTDILFKIVGSRVYFLIAHFLIARGGAVPSQVFWGLSQCTLPGTVVIPASPR